jgi:hypothetical protein
MGRKIRFVAARSPYQFSALLLILNRHIFKQAEECGKEPELIGHPHTSY